MYDYGYQMRKEEIERGREMDRMADFSIRINRLIALSDRKRRVRRRRSRSTRPRVTALTMCGVDPAADTERRDVTLWALDRGYSIRRLEDLTFFHNTRLQFYRARGW